MLTRRSLMLAGLAIPAAAIGARAALALTPQQEVIDKSRITFDKLITSVEFGELPGYMKRAKAILIFPELYKGGFVLGAEGGYGILAVRKAGDGWSQPAFYDLVAGSVGLQIGGQVSEVVLTIMSDKALNAVLTNQLKFGGDMSIAVGPIGKGLGADTTTNMQADVYTFAKTAGLFGGVSFEGAGIIKKDDWNRAYYGQGATPRGIVVEGKFKNPNTQALLNSLQPY